MPFILIVLLVAVSMLFPETAWAQHTVNPEHGNAWDVYVFGNGRVIFDIMNSIKMLMVPDVGESGFITLLTFLAVVGFLVLAVGAGFDPAKNLIRMFFFIIVVWMVTLFTTRMTANLNIIDLYAETGTTATYTVTGVPASVALPAAVTSQVGHYFGRVIETYFTMPDEFKMVSGGTGQFNLFGKMVHESTQYNISSPELKRSLSAYVADCVVPAIARNTLKGPALDEDGKETFFFGTQALLRTTDMLKTLETAKHQSIMTKYYSMDNTYSDSNPTAAPGLGQMMSCGSAFEKIQEDVNNHATALLKRGTDTWSKTGILVPYETVFSSMMASAAASGGTTYAGYSSPKGFIMQQAFLNTMSGGFRHAAIQTGNNEIMQAAAIAQAEHQQKSAWAASFALFNNMMGYVFTVLQAFIFAITPFVIVALMIPGVGKTIFKNYAQILIWLTLWSPMLAIINYIITLFGTDSVSLIVQMDGGISASNKALIAEKTNDLMIAAGFFGTMTPMITWGIVKGAMAFTEFISQGVGSAFATQAGAAAATGNLSMNNLSMDNASLNKYNTAMASTVGFQPTNAFTSAGSMITSAQFSGSNAAMHGQMVKNEMTSVDSISDQLSGAKQVSKGLSAVASSATGRSSAYQLMGQHTTGSTRAQGNSKVDALMDKVARTLGVSDKSSADIGTKHDHTINADNQKQTNVGIEGNVSAGTPRALPISGGASFRAGMTGTSATTLAEKLGMSEGQMRELAQSLGITFGKDGSNTLSDSDVKTLVYGALNQDSWSSGVEAAFRNEASEMLGRNEAYVQQLSRSLTVAQNMGVSNGVDAHVVSGMVNTIQDSRAGLEAGMRDVSAAYGNLDSQAAERYAGTQAAAGDTFAGNMAGLGAQRQNAQAYAPEIGTVTAQTEAWRKNMSSVYANTLDNGPIKIRNAVADATSIKNTLLDTPTSAFFTLTTNTVERGELVSPVFSKDTNVASSILNIPGATKALKMAGVK